MTRIHDVLIVGAGPTGLNAARILARSGLDVIVLEAKDDAGMNIVCSGILGKDAFERFQFPGDSIKKEIQTVKMVSPFGTSFTYRHKFPFAYIVDRERFDKNLADLAVSSGAEIRFGHRVAHIKTSGDRVDVHCGNGDGKVIVLGGRTVVISTGIDHELSKKLKLGYPERFIKAAQKNCTNRLYRDFEDVTLLFGMTVARGGFGWMVNAGSNTIRVGLMSESNPVEGLKRIINTYLNGEDDRLQTKPIAQGLVSRTYDDRILIAGEAAGQVKTTTGGGVLFGLLAAEIASRTIVNAFKRGDFSRNFLASYEKEWKALMGKEIKTGYMVRGILNKLNDTQIERMFKIVQSDGFFDFILQNADFDWHGGFVVNFLKRMLMADYRLLSRL